MISHRDVEHLWVIVSCGEVRQLCRDAVELLLEVRHSRCEIFLHLTVRLSQVFKRFGVCFETGTEVCYRF